MIRKNLTAAVLAGLAGAAGIASTAQAVNLNPDGLGQVLVYPYYTVRNGNSTIMSVVNTSDQAKAVKVRFLEGQNSLEVLDFNLYLSAFDVWTAALAEGTVDEGFPGEGEPVATLFTNDTSCTVPYLFGDFGGEQDFLVFGLNDQGAGAIDEASAYTLQGDFIFSRSPTLQRIPGGPMRTMEGYIEVIEMGVLSDEEENSATAATHDDGVPEDCQQLVAAWTETVDGVIDEDDGYWIQDALIDISAPTGGLFGGAGVVNPGDGTLYSYDARAINGFATTRGGSDPADVGVNGLPIEPLHAQPGRIVPDLNSGDVTEGIVFLDDGTVESFDFFTIPGGRSVDAVSYVFMHDEIYNEYSTEAVAGAASEWVINFPTKKFYVFPELADDAINGIFAPRDPFVTVWSNNFEEDDIVILNDQGELADIIPVFDGACEPVLLDNIFDREEGTPVDEDDPVRPPIVSPAPPEDIIEFSPFTLCYETQVIRFGEAGDDDELIPDSTEILGSINFTNFDNVLLGFENGWAAIDFVNYLPAGALGEIDLQQRNPLGNLTGLPVTGFWVVEFTNGFIEDDMGNLALGNYGGLYNHKGTRGVSEQGTAPPNGPVAP